MSSPPGSTRGRSGSQGGSPQRSPRPSSPALEASGQAGGISGGRPHGSEKERDPFAIREDISKRFELPPEAYVCEGQLIHDFAQRPSHNETGQAISVEVNQFRVVGISNPDIQQYDITLEPKPEKPIVFVKAWNSKAVQGFLKTKFPMHEFLYDNRALAWSFAKSREERIKVDLDAEQGRRPNPEHNNVFELIIRHATQVRLESLRAYLKGTMAWDNSILECMSFLDHALRQGSSERFKLMKRVLVNNSSESQDLGHSVEAIKGIYSTMRLNQSIGQGGLGLGVNVDVSNQAFWKGMKFTELIRNHLMDTDVNKWGRIQVNNLAQALRPVRDNAGSLHMSEAFKALRRLHKIRFEVTHRNDGKVYSVKCFHFDAKLRNGGDATSVTFKRKMQDGSEKTYIVADYYKETYNQRLQYPELPLIETNRGGFFPIELCEVGRFNPYPFKLSPDQTSAMIRFAVKRPRERKIQIANMISNLNWAGDKYLRHFGIRISPQMQKVTARLLPAPKIEFEKKKTLAPQLSGRWDLRGCRFIRGNREPLKAWAFVVLDSCVDKITVENFAKVFANVYKGHGGNITAPPVTYIFTRGVPIGKIVNDSYHSCRAHFKADPQIIFYVMSSKAAHVYEELKKNADCRFAFVTQMVQGDSVKKAQGQYCSNVAMKVNAKLGGQTCRVEGQPFFTVPTMVIGVDVSHSSPGSASPSIAAMCVSMDKDTAVYNAAVQTNGWRTEIVKPTNTYSMLGPLAQRWVRQFGMVPKHVIYFRDGVSEGQFSHVIEYELSEMKNVFKRVAGGDVSKIPKFTVIIAGKRHHIRFFPSGAQDGDRNSNPFPGTLVDREVTHPFHYDFYLCSHVAIQGTARPVHYNVILDEIKWKPEDLQKMIYHQCYQYCRSTTPVSLHPAVYYAHLAGARARAHDQTRGNEGTGGLMAKGDSTVASSQRKDENCPKLLALGAQGQASLQGAKGFSETMWWV
ncbi:ribonuclease H-like domain-containing protein [Cercophora scortea]|uniref:Ribonuclease H-like domain-containing protein n=1 Tax=Cercophora scortea TaxID=314031 RepID=A0AAE0M625_9PEZI|nr:ribonuclease H-like domain-containing protein [Cercophora scortea]